MGSPIVITTTMSDGKTPPEHGSDHDDRKEGSDGIDFKIRRRDVMKAAGAAGIAGSGLTGVASAHHSDCEGPLCCDDCEPQSPGPDLCRNCLPDEAEFLTKENSCDPTPPSDATHGVVKAGGTCHSFTLGEIDCEDVTTADGCGASPGFSHVEYYEVPCPYDQETLCLTEFSCCTVAGEVRNLDANCPVDVVLLCGDGSTFDSTTLSSDNQFSFDVDCACTPAIVELRDPDGNVLDTEDHSGELTCSVTPDSC